MRGVPLRKGRGPDVPEEVAISNAVRKLEPVTIAEFDAFLDQPGNEDGDYELIDGAIVAVEDNTIRHARITGNLGAPLKLAMDGRGYHAFQRGIGLQRNGDLQAFNKLRPDVLVCGDPTDARNGLLNFVDNAIVVVEVLSPSSIVVDRGPKFKF
jgi:Uma2 family endonuclease